MGRKNKIDEKPFTEETLLDRDLIIQMLKYEDSIILGDEGKIMYADPTYKPRVSLTPEYAIQRKTLSHFGFDTSDASVENYRKIFRTYYESPTCYDKDVLCSVAYMRENKCVYYTDPIIELGQEIPDCDLYDLYDLYDLSATNKVNIKTYLGTDFNYAFVAAFSTS